MPTFQTSVRSATGPRERDDLGYIFSNTKDIVRVGLSTDGDQLDPYTSVAGTLVEAPFMDPRFDQFVVIDALVTEERLAVAEVRIRQIRDELKSITGYRDKIGIWLHLQGDGELAGQSFWCSTYMD